MKCSKTSKFVNECRESFPLNEYSVISLKLITEIYSLLNRSACNTSVLVDKRRQKALVSLKLNSVFVGVFSGTKIIFSQYAVSSK